MKDCTSREPRHRRSRALRRVVQRPRRSSAYTPASEPDIVAWFDPSFGITMDGSNRVSGIVSRVGGHLLAQGSGPAQPLWEAAGILGQNALYYTTDDYLATLDATLANALDGSQPMTVYAAIDRDSAAASHAPWCIGVNSGTPNEYFYHQAFVTGDVDNLTRRTVATGSVAIAGSQVVGTSAVRMTASFTGASMLSWVGATASINAAISSTPTCDRFYVGAAKIFGTLAAYMQGRIGDVLAFSTAHDATTRARIWAWMQAKYVGLT